jgi:hypothetical protein
MNNFTTAQNELITCPVVDPTLPGSVISCYATFEGCKALGSTVHYLGIKQVDGQASHLPGYATDYLPSYRFVYVVEFSSIDLTVYITYDEIGSEIDEDPTYDVEIHSSGDSVGITESGLCITDAINAHKSFGHALRD